MNEQTQFELEAKRSLLDRGMSGWLLKPALDWAGSDESFCLQLGEHNQQSTVFRDGDLIVGVRLLCSCALCLCAQSHFVLEHRSQLYGLGMRSRAGRADQTVEARPSAAVPARGGRQDRFGASVFARPANGNVPSAAARRLSLYETSSHDPLLRQLWNQITAELCRS